MSRARQDVLLAGTVAALVSGAPSTLWALARREDMLAAARAAGALRVPDERRTGALLLAAAPVHLGLSIGWAAVLGKALPPRAEPAWGAVGGLAIAALDLGLIGRRLPAIRGLPQGPQWADHVAFGVTVGVVLQRRRRRR